jgi:hypothetical protein
MEKEAGTIAADDRGKTGECYILGNDEVSFKNLHCCNGF